MDVLETLRSRLRDRLSERDAHVVEMESILSAVESEQRSELSSEEDARFSELREAITTFNADIVEIEARISEGDTIVSESVEAREASIPSETADVTEARVSVKSEPMTYRQGGQHSYFKDLALSQAPGIWDGEARARLARHSDETALELRTNMSRTDGQGGEFVPPLWLTQQYVALARAGRVTADLSSKFELPAGTDSINLPKISGGSTVTGTTDGSAASNTDMTTATVTAPVNTYAGQQVFALALLEQSPINFDQVVFSDLIAAHAQAIGAAVIGGSGTGVHEGILTNTAVTTVTYTATTPTGTGVYTAIAQAVSNVARQRYLPAQAIVMNPQRWYWLSSQADGNGRPLVVPNSGGPFNAVGVMTDAQAEGSVGSMLGMPVYLDPNIASNYGSSTNQDRVIVARFSDLALFEGPARSRVLFETDANTLQVRLQVYNYSAFTSRRYSTAIAVCSGTGFAAPSGY